MAEHREHLLDIVAIAALEIEFGLAEAVALDRDDAQAEGVRDMVRISDARMSGTAYGTVVLHVAPEAAVGGPLGAVRDGDEIELDVPNRRITLAISEDELSQRLTDIGRRPRSTDDRRGWRWLNAQHVLQADRGCDLDFCRADWSETRVPG
jgi:dihydroxy-acid dehydratase